MANRINIFEIGDEDSHVALILTGEVAGQENNPVPAGDGSPPEIPAAIFKVREVVLDLSAGQRARSASFLLAGRADASLALDIPMALLKAEGDDLVFRPYEELRDGAAADRLALLEKARSDLRRALAEPFELVVGTGTERGRFLGLAVSDSQEWAATAWLSPDIVDGYAALDDRTVVFGAEARAAVEVTLNGASEPLHAEAVLSLAVRKTDVADLARAVRCAFRVDGDFSLRLPEFDFPDIRIDMPDWKLDVPDISRWLPSINGFSFLPSGLFGEQEWKLAIEWGGNEPKLAVKVEDGALALDLRPSEPGGVFQGKIRIGSAAGTVDIGRITALQASLRNDALGYRLGLEATAPFSLPDRRIDSEALPFILDLQSVTIAPGFEFDAGSGAPGAGFRAKTDIGVGRLVVTARDNPAIFLALSAELAVEADAAGKLATKLTSLRIVEPYPLELVKQGGELAGRLIRLIAAVPLPSSPDPDPAVRLLRRMAELLASAARWLARQAGKVAGLLAGVAEAVAEALIALVEGLIGLGTRLGQDGKRLLTHVSVEVRLDPETWRVRQIAVMPAFDGTPTAGELSASALGFDIAATLAMHPALVFDFGPGKWFGLIVRPDPTAEARIATDFWLERASAPAQAMGTSGEEATAQARLVEIRVKPADRMPEIAVAAIRRGRLRLFDMLGAQRGGQVDVPLPGGGIVNVVELAGAELTDSASIAFHVGGRVAPGQPAKPDFEVHLDYDEDRVEALRKRVLALLPKPAPDSGSGGGVLDSLRQKVEFTGVSYAFKGGATPTLEAGFDVVVHLADNFAPQARLAVAVGLRDLSMRLTAGDRIGIFARTGETTRYRPLGLDLAIRYDDRKKPPPDWPDRYEQFFIDLSRDGERFGLGREAKAELSFAAVSTAGRGLLFDIAGFSAGRGGFDFDATVRPDPVRLGGVDVPFRFTSGRLAIRQSNFNGASLAGSGQLPPALVGEANANVALQLGAGADGSVVVESATARLDKSGDPIRCNAIRFELTITELGFSFVYDGSYHFYFQLSGSAVFRPAKGEFSSGLLKSFRDVEIRLDKAPLAADPRVLMRSISFHTRIDPPKQAKFFDLFAFEMRGIGFHPASDAFGGDPALSISGKVDFTDFGDVPLAGITVHGLHVSTPAEGRVLPRIRFDGLGVAIHKGPLKIDATAIAVDGSLPKDLHRPDMLPADVTAEGFLARGSIELSGWAPMSAAMGFLALRDEKGGGKPRHSFFVYGQFEKQTVPIPTPVGEIYLREYGFGFGYRYTLAGIARAETASSPQELVSILDEVSKYQGSLDDFRAWRPDYENSDLTLALRGLFSIARSERSQGDVYDEKGEAELPNPLLFDIVAALRTDLTFLINLRGWIAVNYNDWADAPANADWKSKPTMRGYLYLSVPRKEFLGRFLAGGDGHIGEHPKLPEPLRKAIRASDFSATLYIRPGLYHFELGWPYELGFELGKAEDPFHLVLRGGLVQRVEDAALLTGIAFRASGRVHLEGRIGSGSFGAAAVARAGFEIEARLLSYLSLRRFGDSFYYGYFRFDATLSIGVSVWISFRIFRKRIRLSVGFSLQLSVSVAIEAVITGEGKLGGRAHASVGVRAFGRSLSVGIGFSFNSGQLDQARARVARFMALGLGTQIPDRANDGRKAEIAPPPLVPSDEATAVGDDAVDHDLGSTPAPVDPPPPGEEDHDFIGDAFMPTDFWAILFPANASGAPGESLYVMQLVPRDHADLGPDAYKTMERGTRKSTFYTSPQVYENGKAQAWHRLDFCGGKPHPITQITAGEDGRTPSIKRPEDPSPLPLPLACEAIVDSDPVEGDLDFAGYLSGLFLLRSRQESDPDGLSFVASEPRPRIHADASVLPEDAAAAALELGRAGRSRVCLTAQQKREAEIAEARSATIASVCESAAQIAASLL